VPRVHSGEEILPKRSTTPTLQTTDRQQTTDRRICDRKSRT